MRLNRFLASAGLGSRRSCENLIREGAVTRNGHICTELATDVGESDEIRVHGKVLQTKPLTYLILCKPKGFVCTRSDPHAKRTIYDLLPPHFHDLAHVGRLDKDSSGLLLLTNDGALTQRMTHPSHEVDKEYVVELDKAFDPEHTARLLRGFNIEGGWGKMESVFSLGAKKLRVVLRQGINRQIRKMFYRLGYEVEKLERTRIGPLREEEIKPGQWRILKKEEIKPLQQAPPKPRRKSAKSAGTNKPAGSGFPKRSPKRSSPKPRAGRARR